jgi:hypothetical protein
MSINDKLIELRDLMEILGYSDMRSVKSFCMENKIPLFNLGKRTYTVSNFLDLVIANEFGKNYSNGDEILKAINDDDKEELIRLLEAPTEKRGREKYKMNVKNSPAAEKLLRKLNEV